MTEKQAIERIKQDSMLFPQTMSSFEGCEGRSIIIFRRASLPGGVLPKTETKVALFHTKALSHGQLFNNFMIPLIVLLHVFSIFLHHFFASVMNFL